MKIQIADADTLTEVIETRQPPGLFLCREGRRWVAVDNSTGDAWTEDFRWKFRAVQWLKGKFEMSR